MRKYLEDNIYVNIFDFHEQLPYTVLKLCHQRLWPFEYDIRDISVLLVQFTQKLSLYYKIVIYDTIAMP